MIKQLIKKFLILPLVARVAISLVGSMIGGIGVGVISEYAAYSYALNEGFRPPFEGIPYLRPTVSAFTFFLILGLFSVFAFFYFVIGLPLARIRKIFVQISDNLKINPDVDKGYIEREFQSIEKLLKSNKAWVFESYGIDISPVRESIDRGDDPILSLDIMNEAILGSKILNPMIPIWIASMSAFFVVIGLSLSLFNPKLYNKLLCSMTYGGDIPVTLYIRNDGISPVEKDEGKLVLRSQSAITISSGSIFREYPVSSILAVDYKPEYSCFKF